MVDQSNLFGHGERDQVGETPEAEDDAEEGGGGGLSFEVAGFGLRKKEGYRLESYCRWLTSGNGEVCREREGEHTRPIASPSSQTTPWSAMVAGRVMKKKASVMWKREMEVRIVVADMSPMVTDGFICRCRCRDSRLVGLTGWMVRAAVR